MDNKNDDWIEKQNKKIIHWLWIIFVSMVTALITTTRCQKFVGDKLVYDAFYFILVFTVVVCFVIVIPKTDTWMITKER